MIPVESCRSSKRIIADWSSWSVKPLRAAIWPLRRNSCNNENLKVLGGSSLLSLSPINAVIRASLSHRRHSRRRLPSTLYRSFRRPLNCRYQRCDMVPAPDTDIIRRMTNFQWSRRLSSLDQRALSLSLATTSTPFSTWQTPLSSNSARKRRRISYAVFHGTATCYNRESNACLMPIAPVIRMSRMRRIFVVERRIACRGIVEYSTIQSTSNSPFHSCLIQFYILPLLRWNRCSQHLRASIRRYSTLHCSLWPEEGDV